MPMTPEELFTRYRDQGDADALGELFDQLAPKLMLVAARLTDGHAAEDLVQSTFVDVIEHRDRWDPNRPLVPWLIGMLGVHVRRKRRSSLRKPDQDRLGLREALQDEDSPPSRAELHEVLTLVQDEVQRLPRNYRRVLMLRLIDGLTVPQIANRLDQPLGTTKTHLHRGLEILRRALPPAVASVLAVFAFPTATLAAARAAVLERAAHLVRPVPAAAPSLPIARTLPLPRLLGGLALLAVVGLVTVWAARGAMQVADPPSWTDTAAAALPSQPPAARHDPQITRRPPASADPSAGATPAEPAMVRFLVVDAETRAPVPFAPVAYRNHDLDWANETRAAVDSLRSVAGSCAFEQFRTVGKTARTDAAGRLALPLQHRLFVACQTPSAYGELARIATTYDWRVEQVIEMRPDRALTVRVVDEQGQPLAGVRVRAVPTSGGRAIPGRSTGGDRSCYYATSDARGRIVVHNVRHWAQGYTGYGSQSGTPRADGCRIELATSGHGVGGTPVHVDLDAIPAEPVALVAPATGHLALTLIAPSGHRLAAARQLWLDHARARGPSKRPARRRKIPLGGSWFTHVALGHRFRIGLHDFDDPLADAIVGPSAPGEVLHAELPLPADAVALCGTVVDPSSAPVRGRFQLTLAADSYRLNIGLKTDEDGRFCRVLSARRAAGLRNHPLKTATLQQLALLAPTGWVATLDTAIVQSLAPLHPSLQDLGRFQLQQAPHLASGTLYVDNHPAPAGLACDGIGVDELRVEFRPGPNAPWQRLPCQSIRWHDGAHFSLHGLSTAGELRLVADSRLHLPCGPIPFSAGETGLAVHLTTGAELTAELQLRESLRLQDFGATLRPEQGSRPARIGACSGSNKFLWRGVPAGRYRLDLRTAGQAEPVCVIRNIEVGTDGTCSDHRLRAIVPPAQLEVTAVHVRTTGGTRLPVGAILWNGDQHDSFGVESASAVVRCVGPARRRFWIGARGYATRWIETSQATQYVTLTPLQQVELRLPEWRDAEAECILDVRRRPQHEFPHEPFVNVATGRRRPILQLHGYRTSHRLAGARSVTIGAQLGERLQLAAWRITPSDSSRVAGLAPAFVWCTTSSAPTHVRLQPSDPRKTTGR